MSNFYEFIGYTLRIDAPHYISNAGKSSSLSQFNYVHYKEFRTLDSTAQVKITIVLAAKFLRFLYYFV